MWAAVYLALLLAQSGTVPTAEQYRRSALEFSRQKNFDQAIENYRKALALQPGDAETHYNLALALRYKGDAREAVRSA